MILGIAEPSLLKDIRRVGHVIWRVHVDVPVRCLMKKLSGKAAPLQKPIDSKCHFRPGKPVCRSAS